MAPTENREGNDESDRAKDRRLVRDTIYEAIKDRDYYRAATLIDAARQDWPADENHHLLSLEAKLRKEIGLSEDCIDLMRQARAEAPSWLPHSYRLANYLMDAERWAQAEAVLDDLIHRCEALDDDYFLDTARVAKIVCLKKLGRGAEIAAVMAELPPEADEFFRERGFYFDD